MKYLMVSLILICMLQGIAGKAIKDDVSSIVNEVWIDTAMYFQKKDCNDMFLQDFFKEYPKYVEIKDRTEINQLYDLSKLHLKGRIEHKVIVLMFKYKDMRFVIVDLSLDDLHLSLNKREILSSVYFGYFQILVFDKNNNFIGELTDQ